MSTDKFNLNLNYSTVDLNSSESESSLEKIKNTPVPNFAKYIPDLTKLKKLRKKYEDKKNIIVEGNGGAISNFRGIYSALGSLSSKNVYLLDTEDPDYIFELRKKCKKENTLVILTSKSGTRIQVLANYFALQNYPLLIITQDNAGALNQIRKTKNLDVSFYPEVDITDRYTGITESALTAAEIVGIDTEEIVKGGKDMYENCSPGRGLENNLALKLALTLDKLENLGYAELFLSVYSKKLSGFFELITQLFHEGVCKNRVGQTIYGGEAPENQHHTLQRFISGRKNSVGFFVTVKNYSKSIEKELNSKTSKFSSFLANPDVENDLKKIKCRNLTLEKLNSVSLEDIIKAEFQGTWQNVIDNKIPAIHLEIESISPYTIDRFTAFFQYTSFYSALLRSVNPCDQPGVEKSKENIFKLIEKINKESPSHSQF